MWAQWGSGRHWIRIRTKESMFTGTVSYITHKDAQMQKIAAMETGSALPSSPGFLVRENIESEISSPSSSHELLLHWKRRLQRSHTEGSKRF